MRLKKIILIIINVMRLKKNYIYNIKCYNEETNIIY